MEWHIQCDPEEISRYVFCPGDQSRAKKIADQMDDSSIVAESRGYTVYSGNYDGMFMTACGAGMGGPTTAIALEELAHMGADTFMRVGSCGVFQEDQEPGDIIISSGTYRAGGTANAYLPLNYPAVPTFTVSRMLVEAAEALNIPHTVGVGVAGDAFYAPPDPAYTQMLTKAGIISIEMESDTLFILGAYRGWRTGAIYTSDGAPGVIKPDWGEAAYRQGEQQAIKIALKAMKAIAEKDAQYPAQ